MGGGLFSVNILLHDTVLEDTDGGEEVQRVLVTGIDTVKDQANNLQQSR